ncbi:2-dehydro-3-deoxygluconate kinase [Rubellimicrobium mesophilum DSM 19309]|uniref:2-dehydro-3-deoxygluconate kinase n=1 Tax=Rubellimicrobium mesophilum DSM 19309 TaxID=442562 RepID=A0A017HRA7_9RHOB|nr:sugar kinase [Rubellimicrobium mesophilum]EYD76688.1 2-dehydro-3-deoxygluconate kinase [Rubellimicrobium mesophilum DSM 19309]
MDDTPHRIACLGEAMVELSGLDPRAGTLAFGVAGDTLNTAIYLRRALGQGARVAYLTALGDDAFSDRMISAMEEEGLDTSAVARLPGRLPGLYAINVDDRGERTFSYWRSESAARSMLGEGGLDPESLGGFDVLFLSGITLAILPPEARMKLIGQCSWLKAMGRTIAFDTNYRPRLWDSEDSARATFSMMWDATTIALPSRDDEARLHPGESVPDLFERLARKGVREIALKDGSAGPHLWAEGRALLKGAYPPAAKVVDTTAAGDGFNAGYLAARLRGAPVEEAAQAGHALASRIIGVRGAILPRG